MKRGLGTHLRIGLAALAIGAFGAVGCGDDESDADGGTTEAEAPAPLALDDRLLEAVRGFEIEEEFDYASLDELLDPKPPGLGRYVRDSVADFEEAGYEASDGRLFTNPSGDAVFNFVIETGSAEGATEIRDIIHAKDLLGCPKECILTITEFTPAGIPGALGATAVEIPSANPGPSNFDTATIEVADENYIYYVQINGPPEVATEAAATNLAKQVYEKASAATAPAG